MDINKNTIIYSVVSLIVMAGFLFGVYKLTSTPPTPIISEEAKVVKADDHTKWSKDKKNILVEYSDLQCPACKSYHDAITSMIETTDIPKNMTFVCRHFPLYSVHPHAEEAAYAAEAAAKQNKFFEMVDLMFDTQDTWSKEGNPKEYFVKLAQQLKLNEEQFKKDMDSPEVKKKVENDVKMGNTATVNSTPTFFLNGEKLTNVRSFEEFKQRLESAGK